MSRSSEQNENELKKKVERLENECESLKSKYENIFYYIYYPLRGEVAQNLKYQNLKLFESSGFYISFVV